MQSPHFAITKFKDIGTNFPISPTRYKLGFGTILDSSALPSNMDSSSGFQAKSICGLTASSVLVFPIVTARISNVNNSYVQICSSRCQNPQVVFQVLAEHIADVLSILQLPPFAFPFLVVVALSYFHPIPLAVSTHLPTLSPHPPIY